MSKKTLIIIGVVVVVVFCAVLSANVNNINKLPDPTPTPAATESGTVTAGMVADMVDNAFRQKFQYSYETNLDEEAGRYVVDIWSPEITSEAVERTKESGNTAIWDNMVSDLTSTVNTIQNAFNDNNHDEIVVVMNLRDPDNRDVIFLTIANGVAGYDVVNGVDLLNK